MQIVIVSAANETVTLSLVDAKRRLEEARAYAAATNEKYFEVLLNTDPADKIDIHEQVEAELKIDQAERDAELAWDKYEKAIMRYGWDIYQARKAGVIE